MIFVGPPTRQSPSWDGSIKMLWPQMASPSILDDHLNPSKGSGCLPLPKIRSDISVILWNKRACGHFASTRDQPHSSHLSPEVAAIYSSVFVCAMLEIKAFCRIDSLQCYSLLFRLVFKSLGFQMISKTHAIGFFPSSLTAYGRHTHNHTNTQTSHKSFPPYVQKKTHNQHQTYNLQTIDQWHRQ